MSTSYINYEAEEYFKNLADNREALDTRYQHLCHTLEEALANQDYALLLSLIPYIETGDGHLTYEHIGEVRRILRLLNIIALEHKYSNETFACDCFCLNELMTKYFLTLFAFRRLLFQLSDTSCDEAIQYLQSNSISHFAAYIIASEELLKPTPEFYEMVLNIYTPYWTSENILQFRLLISQAT